VVPLQIDLSASFLFNDNLVLAQPIGSIAQYGMVVSVE